MPQQDLKAVFRGANPLGKKVRLVKFKSFTNIGTQAFLFYMIPYNNDRTSEKSIA